MSKQITGISTRLCGVTEAAFNTIPGVPMAILLPFVSSTVQVKQTRDKDATLAGYRGMPRGVLANKDVSGAINVNAAPGSFGWWLQHLIGVPTKTGAAAPFTYTFNPNMPGTANGMPPGFTLEQDMGSDYTAAERYTRFSGCRINQAKLSLKPSGFLSTALDILGASMSRSAVALDAAPTANDQHAFPAMSGGVTVNSGVGLNAPLTQFDLAWNNNLDNSLYTIGGGGTRGALPEGNAEVTGSFTLLLQDDSVLAQILADQDFLFAFSVQNGLGDGSSTGNEKLTVNVPAAACEIMTPTIPGPKGITVTGNFSAQRAVGELGVNAVLLSPLVSIEAA